MAVTKYIATARKIQTACNKRFGVKLLINSRQWYSKDADRAITQYIILQTFSDGDNVTNVELFKTYSQVQLLLFMRDFWYKLNGWEVPTDNEIWNEVKNHYNENRTNGE